MITLFFLFFYFSKVNIYGKFTLIKEVGLFTPSKYSFSSLLERKRRLLFLEGSNKIILFPEGVFKPLIFDTRGNYLGYLETSFYYAKKINYKGKEIIVLSMGNALEFYILKNKTLSFYQKLIINEYIENFDFFQRKDSFLIILSCSDKKENKIKLYDQNFKLIAEKIVNGNFFVESLFDTFILGIEKNFKKLLLLNKKLHTLWEFSFKNLSITDYVLYESLLVLTCGDKEQRRGVVYFLSIKNGKILKTFPPSSFYPFSFSSIKISDVNNDNEKDVILTTSGEKGEVFIFKEVRGELILKKKRIFAPQAPFINKVGVLILDVDDFIDDKNKNKELILLITYEQKEGFPWFSNFISGKILLVDCKLREVARLNLNIPLSDFLIIKKERKILVTLTEKLRFYE